MWDAQIVEIIFKLVAARTEEKIIEVASGIRRKEFDAKTGKHCDWCDYKNLACPAWEQ